MQEALLAAAQQWRLDGVPQWPRGWLIRVASRKLTDLLRAQQARRCREDAVANWALPADRSSPAADVPAGDADDTLVLPTLCCHPTLSQASQVALTLRAVGGPTTAEIARAKRTIQAGGILCSGCRRGASGRSGWTPCCTCSASSSPRDTPRRPGPTCTGRTWRPRRSGRRS